MFLASIGVTKGLHLSMLVLVMRSSIYFCWGMFISLFDLITSRPRKYCICPKPLISNSVAKDFLSLNFFLVSSSDYVIIIYYWIAFFSFSVCQKNIVWSNCSCWYSCFLICKYIKPCFRLLLVVIKWLIQFTNCNSFVVESWWHDYEYLFLKFFIQKSIFDV